MSKKNQILASKRSTADTDTVPPNQKRLSLEARKPHLGEDFYRTGNMVARLIVHTQEIVGVSDVVGNRFMPVTQSALGPILTWAKHALFFETVSETGEHFADPQILGEDPSTPAAWKKCESEMLDMPLMHWMSIEPCEDCGGYQLGIGSLVDNDQLGRQDFEVQLDAALAPNLIDSADHPMARRLRAIFSHDEEDEALSDWQMSDNV